MQQPSILKSLRNLSPQRQYTFAEALGLAERQAAKLNQLLAATHPGYQLTGITEDHIAALPRVRVVHDKLPVSGMSHWNGREWIICLNSEDPEVRQRFTLLHEFKHIIDHGQTEQLYTGEPSTHNTTRRRWTNKPSLTAREQAERAADFFAGCALVPRTALKHAWASGIQTPGGLADHFAVSEAAIRVRLDQTGVARERDPDPDPDQPSARCARPIWTPRWRPQRFTVRRPEYGRR